MLLHANDADTAATLLTRLCEEAAMSQRSKSRRVPPAPKLRQTSPLAGHERSVPVVLITSHGIDHLSFTNGDRASISMRHDRLIVMFGDAE
jgi:hypothetical protein